MKKYLLPENGNFYKANLHCHSTLSDGRWTVEELKKYYMAEGYSIIAFTDHDILLDHSDLTDESFLALNGYEMEISEPKTVTDRPRKCCHICLVALEPDNLTQVCWHREKYLFGNAPLSKDKIKFDGTLPDYERKYTPECISDMMKRGREGGFFVTYNHPTWSLEDYNDYTNYHNMHAMEIVNYGCAVMGYPDYNPRVYDDMLRAGERIYCISTDDNHNVHPYGTPDCDSFGGFTVIKADKLDYRTVTKALEDGHFYASEGPAINELWYENGKIHIECSDAKRIEFCCMKRAAKAFCAPKDGYITEATYEIPEDAGYVRATVIDENGNHANTNAYFLDELNK